MTTGPVILIEALHYCTEAVNGIAQHGNGLTAVISPQYLVYSDI